MYLSKYDNGNLHQPVNLTAVAQKSGAQVESYLYGTLTFAKKSEKSFFNLPSTKLVATD